MVVLEELYGDLDGNVAGAIGGTQKADCYVVYCYNLGNIKATGGAGGIAISQTGGINYSINGSNNITGTNKGGITAYCNNLSSSKISSCIYKSGGISGIGSARNGWNSSTTKFNSNSGCTAKDEIEMPSVISIVGNAFVEDIEGINNGYPLLAWQVETTE